MAINNWKLLEWLGFKKIVQKEDVDADVEAITAYLEDVHYDVDELLQLFKHLEKLRKEGYVLTDQRAKIENVRKQIEQYDHVLLRFEYYTSDAEVNAVRVKNIAEVFKSEAKKHKLYALLDKMKRETRWFFDW